MRLRQQVQMPRRCRTTYRQLFLRANLLQEGSLLLVQFNEMRENVGPSRRSWCRCRLLPFCGTIAHNLFPGHVATAGAYALVGMGTAFAGIVRAPTSVVMIFETTRDYAAIVPLRPATEILTADMMIQEALEKGRNSTASVTAD